MKLTKTFERLRNGQNQVIEVVCRVNSSDDIDDMSYDDFQANLYINGKFIGDISPVLDNAGLFTDMVDSIDWHELYHENKREEAA